MTWLKKPCPDTLYPNFDPDMPRYGEVQYVLEVGIPPHEVMRRAVEEIFEVVKRTIPYNYSHYITLHHDRHVPSEDDPFGEMGRILYRYTPLRKNFPPRERITGFQHFQDSGNYFCRN